MSNTNWILKNGLQSTDCSSFPFAYRSMFNIVRKAVEAGKSVATASRDLTIVGPPDTRGERTKYTYASATELAKGMGLINANGDINSREFKRR